MRENITFFDEVASVGDGQDFTHAVICHEHADAMIFQVTNNHLNIFDSLRVDAGERLIQKNQKWIANETTGDFKATLFTT